MNLADMLTFADIVHLNRIAVYYDCDCKPNSKHELIQGILTKLGSSSFFETQVKELRLSEVRFLNALLFDDRPYFSMEELVAIAKQSVEEDESPGERPRDIVTRLRSSGWLFNGSTHNTRYLFQIPLDMKERFRRVMVHDFQSGMTRVSEPSSYRDEGHLLAEDLRLFLQYMGQHEVPLNPEGAWYRRNQQQLMEHLHIAEPLLGKGGWRFGYGSSFKFYPDRMALLYDYARHSKYIEEKGDQVVLTTKGEAHQEHTIEQEMIQLFRFWLRLYKGAVPNLLSLVYWIGECARPWTSSESLFVHIGPLIRPFYYDTPRSVFDQRIIRMMLHLGMLRQGDHSTGPSVQMTAWGLKLAGECRIGRNDSGIRLH
ncbi:MULTISPECIES: hypothetical protein [Paenibacillus]|uniref:Uncharacterized protein n=1 Tax=Paenibacillus polymyxa TaxID=1406 RepID=A0AAJ3MDV1_PAEPO|nr:MULTISPECIES: hypothetical protein [Paenibacillus]MCP3743221.1 hypothetical protein [Paenibacillus sp. A3M_27_13]MDH2330822.1 hypothetical protein [Paenibacillus polymyxa]ODA07135.1 hypothetical protein A7312_12515 [Paenibacillus polymyxa]OME72803.1 hypothetical protein BK119_07075 [Paenibacillus peoriae]OMF31566.1 hypothetical protein BK134_14655 [Paenibacillus peoriae]